MRVCINITLFINYVKSKILLTYCILSIVNCGCTKYLDDYVNDSVHTIDTVIVSKDHLAIVNMVKKARQMAEIEWEPINKIPSLGDYYYPNNVYTGIPYSSVKEMDKFIGHEVSFHTFMTALNNPRSIIYTENIKELPYHGTNCGAYYGTVCSMAVNYALGLELPYQTSNYTTSSRFAQVYPPIPESISEGDVLWTKGHVILVLDVKRDHANKIVQVTIFESRGRTFIKDYSYADFVNRWNNDELIAYRYLDIESNINYNPIPFVKLNEDPIISFIYNDDLCVSRGDKSSYREGERVEINILKEGWDSIELYRDESLFSISSLDNDDVVYSDLLPGSYKARLVMDNAYSDYTYFEIIDTNVSCDFTGGQIQVAFSSSNSSPEYIVVCKINGSRSAIYDLTDAELSSGRTIIKNINDDEYIKVFFRGEFGRISNFPIGFDTDS